MFIAATLSLLTTLLPQEPSATGQDPKPILVERYQKLLGYKLRKYLEAEIAHEASSGSARDKTSKAKRKAKEVFEKDWDKAEEKGVLGSMVDLRAVFYNCFENKRPEAGKGNFYNKDVSGTDLKYGIYLPKKYTEKTPWTTLVVLSDGTGGNWSKPADYFKKVWGDTAILDESIVHMPVIPEGLEMDPIPDYSREGADLEEDRRIGTVFGSFRTVLDNYNVDRARVFLDCGKGNCGFGVRLATLFPDRFAGLILRDAIEVDQKSIRIGNLLNLPVLMLKTGNNAATVDALKKRWDEKCPGMLTVMDSKGAYPHLESADDIAAWMTAKRRIMTPKEITLEPNHDRFHKTYWVGMEIAESLLTADPDKKPRMEVVADRENNRITVDAQGVERFELLLNDDLIDLDKEFTLVINGKASKETSRRSFRDMKSRMMLRNDWDYLFPVRHMASVTKE